MDSLLQLDYSIFHFINHTISNSFLDVLLPFLRHANNWIPLYIFLAIYLLYKYNIEALKYILYIVLAFALADYISAGIIKPFVARLRPCHSAYLQANLLLGHCGGKWSFPSTHATNHIAIALSIVMANIFTKRWINLCWIIWAIAIGFAQIYVGVHFPSDVLAGIILGSMIAFINWKYILPAIEKMYERLLIR
ncbi:MAG: phosphatase PAP2 family protein [Chitinophagales bacterium]|nr:phosphatase PAP2 family protein [Chitinophagales bacterium]HMV14553.1 phosphatase PAP2 family protein [Chitinophagales bacterium]HMW11623.1 phosphatase PAP2 family protein [Chitinophagales bacterium]HMX60759.1 phosphatase PAP2 family protein [Chitinophagales bacterium]HMZ34440.1 phosphatase PAP2 family protein [Chitinophagales bacterium]